MKAERTLSTLKAALAYKEQELHDQHQELVRLRQAEEVVIQAEAVECQRLRVLTDSLLGELLLPPLGVAAFLLYSSLISCYSCCWYEFRGGCRVRGWGSSRGCGC